MQLAMFPTGQLQVQFPNLFSFVQLAFFLCSFDGKCLFALFVSMTLMTFILIGCQRIGFKSWNSVVSGF